MSVFERTMRVILDITLNHHYDEITLQLDMAIYDSVLLSQEFLSDNMNNR